MANHVKGGIIKYYVFATAGNTWLKVLCPKVGFGVFSAAQWAQGFDFRYCRSEWFRKSNVFRRGTLGFERAILENPAR